MAAIGRHQRGPTDQFAVDERVALLSFTGSPDVGWDLKSRAGRKKVVLELGGNAAVVVEPEEAVIITRNTEIAAVAAEVRKQLGAADRLAITLDDLKAIDKLSVNGLSYELWVDMDRPVHDDDGNEILGVFEFAPLSSTEAVSISVSPGGDLS